MWGELIEAKGIIESHKDEMMNVKDDLTRANNALSKTKSDMLEVRINAKCIHGRMFCLDLPFPIFPFYIRII